MALDIYLQKDTSSPENFDNCFLQFEDDGYYWFLYNFFEDLEKQTGQMIELCDDAFFEGNNLDLLNQTISERKNQFFKSRMCGRSLSEQLLKKAIEQR